MIHTTTAFFARWALSPALLLLAMTSPAVAQAGQPPTYAASWAIVLFCVVLGLIGALRPSARKSEIKKPTASES